MRQNRDDPSRQIRWQRREDNRKAAAEEAVPTRKIDTEAFPTEKVSPLDTEKVECDGVEQAEEVSWVNDTNTTEEVVEWVVKDNIEENERKLNN